MTLGMLQSDINTEKVERKFANQIIILEEIDFSEACKKFKIPEIKENNNGIFYFLEEYFNKIYNKLLRRERRYVNLLIHHITSDIYVPEPIKFMYIMEKLGYNNDIKLEFDYNFFFN